MWTPGRTSLQAPPGSPILSPTQAGMRSGGTAQATTGRPLGSTGKAPRVPGAKRRPWGAVRRERTEVRPRAVQQGPVRVPAGSPEAGATVGLPAPGSH